MDILIIVGLVAFGVILFLVEVFFIPGLSIAALGATASMVYACVYAFSELGNTGGFITLFAVIIISTIALIWFMRSRTLDRLALKTELNESVGNEAERSIQVGQVGIATTRLALIGMAEFDGQVVEVKSIDGFIDEQTTIIVERLTDGTILVKRNS